MKTKSSLRLTQDQHDLLLSHLFPGDGCEAVALALCGRLESEGTSTLCVHELLMVDHELCRERTPHLVTWPPDVARHLFEKAAAKSMAILKIHSHPGGYSEFSAQDDRSDRALFSSIYSWCDDGLPHGSAVMLPEGEMFGRLIGRSGEFSPLERIMIAGDEIQFFGLRVRSMTADDAQLRTFQTFGDRTTSLLRQLSVGVVGCSGTGGWVVEQLARLGIGHLVLVDPKIAERKNLNRIVGIGEKAVATKVSKVHALQEHVGLMGTGSKVTAHAGTSYDEEVARDLAGCDILFGCMDSVEGRSWLNRIAAFYLVPYFDLGVRLDADGRGGISTICGSINYLLPNGSSLLSRKCYSPASLRVDALKRKNPAQFRKELEEGYIKGAKVESPAVVSVNGFCATMAVNELLARLHNFRSDMNSTQRRQQFDLKNSFWTQLPDSGPCPALSKFAGRGDMNPFLNAVGDD